MTEQITTVRIDDFVAERNLIVNYVKIDVEGAEHLVLAGMRETTKRFKPTIFLEVHGGEGEDRTKALQDEYWYLFKNGYKKFKLSRYRHYNIIIEPK